MNDADVQTQLDSLKASGKYTDSQLTQYGDFLRGKKPSIPAPAEDPADAPIAAARRSGKYTESQLAQYENYLRKTTPGMSPDKPEDTPLFSDLERVQQSFGNVAGARAGLHAKGYANVQAGKDGDLEAQQPDGKWVKDQTNFFPKTLLQNPLNYIDEAHRSTGRKRT